MTDSSGAVTAPSPQDPDRSQLPSQVDTSIGEQLVEQARADGVDLVGPDGLSGRITKQVLEAGLEVEMDPDGRSSP